MRRPPSQSSSCRYPSPCGHSRTDRGRCTPGRCRRGILGRSPSAMLEHRERPSVHVAVHATGQSGCCTHAARVAIVAKGALVANVALPVPIAVADALGVVALATAAAHVVLQITRAIFGWGQDTSAPRITNLDQCRLAVHDSVDDGLNAPMHATGAGTGSEPVQLRNLLMVYFLKPFSHGPRIHSTSVSVQSAAGGPNRQYALAHSSQPRSGSPQENAGRGRTARVRGAPHERVVASCILGRAIVRRQWGAWVCTIPRAQAQCR